MNDDSKFLGRHTRDKIKPSDFNNLSGDTPTLNYPRDNFGTGTIEECDGYLFIIKVVTKNSGFFRMFFSKEEEEEMYYATCFTPEQLTDIIDKQYKEYKENKEYNIKIKLLYGYENYRAKQKEFVFPETFSKGITNIFSSGSFPKKERYTQEERIFLLEIDNDMNILKIESLGKNFKPIDRPLYDIDYDHFNTLLDDKQYGPMPKTTKPKNKPYGRVK
jgi:hypothetical protein